MVSNSTKSILNNSSLSLRDDLHVPRKIWHMGTGIMGLSFYFLSGFTKLQMGYGLLIFGVAAFLYDSLRLKVPFLNSLTVSIMRPFMRENERTGYSGFSFYATGVALSLLFYEEKIAVLAACFLVFADPVSSFFGILYGNKKILPNKSLQGTLAGGICCFFISLIYGLIHVGFPDHLMVFVFLSAVAGGLAELLSLQIDDNLIFPVLSGFFLTIVNWLIPLF